MDVFLCHAIGFYVLIYKMTCGCRNNMGQESGHRTAATSLLSLRLWLVTGLGVGH